MSKPILTFCPDHGHGLAGRWPGTRPGTGLGTGLGLGAILAALMVAVLAIPGNPAAARQPTAEAQQRYGQCLAQAERDPAAAAANARAWVAEPGRDAVLATHCLAVALVAEGSYAQAATALQGLVGDARAAGTDLDPAMLLELRVQTGHAWLLAEQPDLAEAMFDLVLQADPGTALNWIDRARARADREHWPAARADLDQALRLDPENPRAYALRASAWRRSGQPARAMEDVELALALAPRMPEALLERGILRSEQGDLSGAREDLLQLRLAAPDSAAAEVAGRMLEEIDRMPDD